MRSTLSGNILQKGDREMNEDAYAEWLVKRKDPAYAVPVKVLLVLVCVGTGMFALGNLLGIIVFFAALQTFIELTVQ